MSLEDTFDRQFNRAKDDAKRHEELNGDVCQLCFATGPDKRNFIIETMYTVSEAIPEVISLRDVEPDGHGAHRWYLRICKSCRARLLQGLADARLKCTNLRYVEKDEDGILIEDERFPDDDQTIWVHQMGIPVRMDKEDYTRFKEQSIITLRDKIDLDVLIKPYVFASTSNYMFNEFIKQETIYKLSKENVQFLLTQFNEMEYGPAENAVMLYAILISLTYMNRPTAKFIINRLNPKKISFFEQTAKLVMEYPHPGDDIEFLEDYKHLKKGDQAMIMDMTNEGFDFYPLDDADGNVMHIEQSKDHLFKISRQLV